MLIARSGDHDSPAASVVRWARGTSAISSVAGTQTRPVLAPKASLTIDQAHGLPVVSRPEPGASLRPVPLQLYHTYTSVLISVVSAASRARQNASKSSACIASAASAVMPCVARIRGCASGGKTVAR